MHKWQKLGWLSEIDLRRITCCLQNMRMLCNSTFLFDKRTHHSPKLAEFREIIRELALEEKRKVVVFSEYERMTYLAGEELGKLKIGFVSLHGSVPSRKRGELIAKFHRDPECKVFLSTDAGGVGLNLQARLLISSPRGIRHASSNESGGFIAWARLIRFRSSICLLRTVLKNESGKHWS
jgi:SNF2 family DNA or RNA helicase